MSDPDYPVTVDRGVWNIVWEEIHKICPTGHSLAECVKQMREEIEHLREINSHLKGSRQ